MIVPGLPGGTVPGKPGQCRGFNGILHGITAAVSFIESHLHGCPPGLLEAVGKGLEAGFFHQGAAFSAFMDQLSPRGPACTPDNPVDAVPVFFGLGKGFKDHGAGTLGGQGTLGALVKGEGSSVLPWADSTDELHPAKIPCHIHAAAEKEVALL